MTASRLLLTGAIVRTAYGLVSLVAPKVLFAPGGEGDPEPDPRYFNALFGGRDLTVAAMTVAAVRAGREREALLINLSCEATDLLALTQELRHREGIDATVAAGIAFNVAGWLSWAQAGRALRSR